MAFKKHKNESTNILEKNIKPSPKNALINEIFSNSGNFLILKSFADIATDGWIKFITDPTEYLLIFTMLIQAWYLSRPNAHHFWGNMIGVSLYTLIDIPKDGLEFFINPIHIVFWIFSIIVATLQGLRYHWIKGNDFWIFTLESLIRALTIVAFYIVVGTELQELTEWEIIFNYTKTPSHKFLTSSMILVGLMLGIQTYYINLQKKQIQETAKILGNLAQWGLGTYAVTTAVNNPDTIHYQECQRTIIFMDIRGFTAWCEQNSPNFVAQLLNKYYQQVEPAANQHQPLRITFTGDEIMAIYATPQQGISAALAMQKAARTTLNPYQIGAGCAVHCGTVIEGLFGSQNVRTYTVIGDVVNTAKRIESITPAGEITISDDLYQNLNQQLKVQPRSPIKVKGKTTPLTVWQLIPF